MSYDDYPVATGGYGSVFRRIVREARIESAVKIVPTDTTTLAAILIEINTLRTLEHPSIVEYFRFEVKPFGVLIEMEWYPYDLCGYRELHPKTFTEPQIMSMFRDIISGVEYLHHLYILHLDLKPSNILVRPPSGVDGQPRCVICDFGCSVPVGITSDQLLGTHTCRPPENFLHKAKGKLRRMIIERTGETEAAYTQATDVFACGILLVYIATGKLLLYPDDRDVTYPKAALLEFLRDPELYIFDLVGGTNPQLLNLCQYILVTKSHKRPSTWDILHHPAFRGQEQISGLSPRVPKYTNKQIDPAVAQLYITKTLQIADDHKVNSRTKYNTCDLVFRFLLERSTEEPITDDNILACLIIVASFFEPKRDFIEKIPPINQRQLMNECLYMCRIVRGYLTVENPFSRIPLDHVEDTSTVVSKLTCQWLSTK